MNVENLVKQSAKKLDEIDSNWYQLVDIKDLNQRDCNRCIGHFVFDTNFHADLRHSLKRNGLNKKAFGYLGHEKFNEMSGFESDEYFSDLKKYWVRSIIKRLENNE